MLVQYHKTGHHASRVIASVLREVLSVRFADVMSRPDGKDPSQQASCQFLVAGAPWQSCYGVQASPDLACRPFPRRLGVVHFVRDPVAMVLSAYLYHAQQPPPESWVHSRHVCPSPRRLDPGVCRRARVYFMGEKPEYSVRVCVRGCLFVCACVSVWLHACVTARVTGCSAWLWQGEQRPLE